ncbi:MAG: invasin domain 3-containing protein [Gemmatimonadota bacterium]
MSPPATHPPGRGTLAAIGLLASLITSLASPLVPDLGAQPALSFEVEPTATAAGQTIMPFVHVRAPGAVLVTITLSIASGPGELDGTVIKSTLLSELVSFDDLSIQVAGTYTLLAEASGYTSDTSIAFQISPGPPDADESEITASQASIPADGMSASQITVRLRDAFGNPLTTGGADVDLATTLGSLSAVSDEGDGTYTATLTAGTAPGTATVSGTVGGDDIDDTVTVQITPAPATQLDFEQQPTNRTAGQTITPAVTVRAENVLGNVDPNFNGPVTLAIATGPSGGQLLGTTTVNASGGLATFNNLSIQRAGTYMLRASSGSLAQDTSVAFQISPAAPSLATSEITADPTSIPADGNSTSTITVQLRDPFGNPPTGGGASVQLDTTLGSLGPVTFAGNGAYTATLTSSTTAGDATISGTLNGADITDTATVTFTLVGQPALDVDVQPEDTPIDEPITPAVVVRVVDGLGNTLIDFTGNVTASLANNPGGATLSGDLVEPLQNGVATFNDLRLNRSGSGYRLRFAVSGAASATSAPFAILAGAASPSTSSITADPVSIPADGSSTSRIEVRLRDADGVPLSTGGDNVNLSTTLGTLSGVLDHRNGTYSATLRSTVAPGTATISGTVNGAPITDTATVAFAAGSADLVVQVEVSDETPAIGDEVVYVVTVSNQGPDQATGIEITQALPPRLQFVSATTSQGEYESATGVWRVGMLADGVRATLTVVARVLDPASD